MQNEGLPLDAKASSNVIRKISAIKLQRLAQDGASLVFITVTKNVLGLSKGDRLPQAMLNDELLSDLLAEDALDIKMARRIDKTAKMEESNEERNINLVKAMMSAVGIPANAFDGFTDYLGKVECDQDKDGIFDRKLIIRHAKTYLSTYKREGGVPKVEALTETNESKNERILTSVLTEFGLLEQRDAVIDSFEELEQDESGLVKRDSLIAAVSAYLTENAVLTILTNGSDAESLREVKKADKKADIDEALRDVGYTPSSDLTKASMLGIIEGVLAELDKDGSEES